MTAYERKFLTFLEKNGENKVRIEESHLSTERNFLTAIRAMSEILLKPSDLEGLRKTKRRSPFENEPPITVYWRRDVEAKLVVNYL